MFKNNNFNIYRVQGDPRFGGNKIKDFSRTFKHRNNLFPNLFHRSFQQVAQFLWHQVRKQYWSSRCCLQFSNDCAIFHTTGRLVTILKFKHFQGPFMLNSKTFKHQILFKNFSGPWKWKNFSRTSKDFQGKVSTLTSSAQTDFSSKMLNFAISFVFHPKLISCVPSYVTLCYLLGQPEKCIANFCLRSRWRESKHLIMCLHTLAHTYDGLWYVPIVQHKNKISDVH